jgi:CheY-like chemotaxis protein
LREYRLTCVPTASGALEFLQRQTPDLILLDHILGQGELGAEFLPRLKEAAAHVPVIMISGTLDIQGQLKVLQGPRSASFVVTKPVDLGELEKTIEIALTECGMGEAVRMLQSIERTEKADLEEPDRRYVDRLARQHDMLKKLRASGDPANVSQLSRDYQVSRRTIARDLRELVQRGQIPAALYPEWDKETTG